MGSIAFEVIETDWYGDETRRRTELLSASVVEALQNEVVRALWLASEGRRQSGVMVGGRFIGVKIIVGDTVDTLCISFTTKTGNYDSFSAHCLYSVRSALGVDASQLGYERDGFCRVDVALSLQHAYTVIQAYCLRSVSRLVIRDTDSNDGGKSD